MTETKKQKQKTYGLVLDQGGAPTNWHSIPDLGLHFHPEIPVPVGNSVPGRTEPSIEQARAWSDDPGMPLRLVEIDADTLAELRDAAATAKKAAKRRPDDEIPRHIGG
jgi:hypothetical protein